MTGAITSEVQKHNRTSNKCVLVKEEYSPGQKSKVVFGQNESKNGMKNSRNGKDNRGLYEGSKIRDISNTVKKPQGAARMWKLVNKNRGQLRKQK